MEATGRVLNEIQRDDVDSPPRPKSEREKLTEEVWRYSIMITTIIILSIPGKGYD